MSFALTATSPTPTCTDRELVAAVRDGSDRAYEELYARYRGRISSYVAGLVGDHGRAEDITQEVFISALRRLRQTERPIAFKAWVYEIAKNACIDEFRRERRAREVPLEADGAEAGHGLVSPSLSPDAAIESKQSLGYLTRAVQGLSENHHRIIVMRELEGLSYSEIGEQLGVSRPVVESTLFRARRRLSQEYDELASGRRCEQVQALIATEEPQALLKLGVRRRRQLARHLAHCQPCRRQARIAGVDDSLFRAPTVVDKIAVLLPLPWLPWRREGSRRSGAGGHGVALAQPLQRAAGFADLVTPSTGLGRALAAAGGVALAGLGGGMMTGVATHGHGAATHGRGAAAIRSAPAVAPTAHPARAAVKRRRSSPGSGAAGAPKHSARSGSGPGGSAAAGGTKAQNPPARGSAGASSASATGHGGGALSTTTSPVSKIVRHVASGAGVVQHVVSGAGVVQHVLSGAGSVAKTVLPPLPQLPKPKVPGVGTTTSPPKVQLPSLPKVGTPAVTTPPKVQLPSLPKVGTPAVAKVAVPNPPRLP